MNIGITGGKGFVGSYLLTALKREGYGYELFEECGKDIEDEVSMKKFVKDKNIIIHLAGKNRGTKAELFRANVNGTQVLLSAVHETSSDTKIIFASTLQVYLDDSFYGFSKKQAENILQFYALNYKIPSIALRFTNLYGSTGKPFYNSVIATFVHQMKSGTTLTIEGDGESRRDYLYVGDAVNAIIKSIGYKAHKRFVPFDVCSGKKYSLKQIVKFLKKNWGEDVRVKFVKKNEKLWSFRVKNKRTRSELRWKPHTPLEEGIVNMLKDES